MKSPQNFLAGVLTGGAGVLTAGAGGEMTGVCTALLHTGLLQVFSTSCNKSANDKLQQA